MLLLGNIKIDDLSQADFFKSTEHLNSSDTASWVPLAIQITKRDLVGIRLFGLFDDVENGVVVYEPVSFSKLHGDWNRRSVASL